MLTIKEKDVRSGVYVGRDLSPEDAVIVPAHIRHIRFSAGMVVKALMTGKGVRTVCGPDTRIRHIKMGGPAVFTGNLFCGSADVSDMMIVGADLVTWLGSVVSHDGSIVVEGKIVSAQDVLARNGAILADSILAEGRVFSLNTWTRSAGEALTGIAAIAKREAESLTNP